MVVTFQESVKKILEWLNTGKSGHFHHPYTNVKEIEPGQFLVIDDMEPPELDTNKIIITEDVAENLVAKLFGMTNKNTAVIQSIISSSVQRNTGIFIPTEYFNKMLYSDCPNLTKINQSSKLILSEATAHISKNRDVKVVINNSKRILPSPNLKTAQPAVKNQATPCSIDTKNSLPVSTTQSSRSILKSINKNSISNVTYVLSKSGKMVPLAITAPEQVDSVKIPETNQRTTYRIVNIQKQNGPIKTIWNPLTPSPTSTDVISPDKHAPEANTAASRMTSHQYTHSEQLAVPFMTFSSLPPNQVFPSSNTNQAGPRTVYQHVTRSPLEENVFNIPDGISSHSTNQMYVQDGQSRLDYTSYDEANCGYLLRKDQHMVQVHLPKYTMSYNNML